MEMAVVVVVVATEKLARKGRTTSGTYQALM